MNISSEAMFETSDFFRIILHRPSYGAAREGKATEAAENGREKTREKKGGQISGRMLSAREEEILVLIGENTVITRKMLSERAGINTPAIQKHLAKLKKSGLLKRVGPDKGGRREAARKAARKLGGVER